MHDLTTRCLFTLSCFTLACTSPSPATEAADDVDSTDSTDSTSSNGSTDSTSSTESTEGSEDFTDTSEDSSESSSTTDEPAPDLPMMMDPNENIPPLDEEGCPGIYAQDILPTFEITVTDEVWGLLVWNWLNGQMLEDQDEDYHPEHPVEEFVYGDIVIHDAVIRLRGNPTNWDPDNKMQFQIDFNEIDEDGRFLGLRHLPLDAARSNRHMLRDRLALSIMRDMGIEAPCANHARLNVNGEYYGIYTSIEKIDKTFLERVFDDPEGDLWKRANWTLKTNENTANNEHLQDLKGADSPSELEDYLDLEQALKVFAAEAIIPASDGMWAGGLNFYVYDEPIGGKFVMLPWDFDSTFETFQDPPEGDYPVNPDPVVWEKPTTHGRPFYTIALQDSDWFEYYIEAIEDQYESSYDDDELHERIDDWTDQIEESVFEDTNKAHSNSVYLEKVEALHDYIDARHDFLDGWLQCWENGGFADDLGYCVLF
jgi:hypothetical protein